MGFSLSAAEREEPDKNVSRGESKEARGQRKEAGPDPVQCATARGGDFQKKLQGANSTWCATIFGFDESMKKQRSGGGHRIVAENKEANDTEKKKNTRVADPLSSRKITLSKRSLEAERRGS